MVFQTSSRRWLVGLAVGCAMLAGHASAALLWNNPPNILVLDGQQADTSSTSYEETISISGPATITKLTFWGFYSDGSDLATDNFILNGLNLSSSGLFTRSDTLIDVEGVDLYSYELALSGSNSVAFSGGPFTLSLINDSVDLEWFWQGTSNPQAPGARALSIEGTRDVQAVPEPGTLALFGLALAGAGFVRMRTRSSR